VQGNCSDADAPSALRLDAAGASELLPLKPLQCLLLTHEPLLTVTSGKVWLDNVYVQLRRTAVRPRMAFVAAGAAETEEMELPQITHSDLYATNVTFHGEPRGSAHAYFADASATRAFFGGAMDAPLPAYATPALSGRARPYRTIRSFRGYYVYILIQQCRMPPNTALHARTPRDPPRVSCHARNVRLPQLGVFGSLWFSKRGVFRGNGKHWVVSGSQASPQKAQVFLGSRSFTLHWSQAAVVPLAVHTTHIVCAQHVVWCNICVKLITLIKGTGGTRR